ncbi:MAG: hypothetical protein ACRCYQ_11060 [Nocardioides sp.]
MIRRTTLALPALLVGLGIAAAIPPSAVGAAPPAAPSRPASAPLAVAPDVGRWSIRRLDTDAWEVTWRSPRRLPIGGDRLRITGADLLTTPVVSRNRRIVSAQVRSVARPRAGQLDIWLSGDRLDTVEDDALRRARARAQSAPAFVPDKEILPQDPATAGPYEVIDSDYSRTPVRLPGMREPIEMVGHVVEPALTEPTGPRPLVVFLHGRHAYCYGNGGDEFAWPCEAPQKEIPSHLGYDYVQRLLASQGYATVSIRVNGINAQDDGLEDGGADARAQIVQRHLDYWTSQATRHQVDLDNVVLVGHSRGGEGVDRAAIQIPLSAPYRIAGQVLLAPTDFASHAAPYVPTVTMLPYCDGDVFDLQGQRFVDSGRDVVDDDNALKSSVLVMGANHNFFNTEWTPGVAVAPAFDDWFGPDDATCGSKTPERLTAAEQRSVGSAYIAAAAGVFTERAPEFLPLFDGSPATVRSMGDADARSHALGAGRSLRRPGIELAVKGAGTALCDGAYDFNDAPELCGRGDEFGLSPHWPATFESGVPTRRFVEFSWASAGQQAELALTEPWDLSGRRLALRTIVDAGRGDAEFQIRLVDADGASAVLDPAGGRVLGALPVIEGNGRRWAQSLIVDPAEAAGVDSSAITEIDLIARSASGRAWVADLAATSTRLPEPLRKRAPRISVGDVRMAEGDSPAVRTARVPLTLSAVLAEDASVSVSVSDPAGGTSVTRIVRIPAGRRTAEIAVEFPADNRDDLPRLESTIGIWGLRQLVTDDYQGGLTVLDDDPAPRVVVKRVRPRVREGSPAEVRISLSRAVDYDLPVTARVVRGPGRDVTGFDVPRRWFERYAFGRRRWPLYRSDPLIFGNIPAGATSTTLGVPIRRDGRSEPREALTLVASVERPSAAPATARRTIRIRASR